MQHGIESPGTLAFPASGARSDRVERDRTVSDRLGTEKNRAAWAQKRTGRQVETVWDATGPDAAVDAAC